MLGPAPTKRLVIATGNAGKLREFRSLLAGLPFELTSSAELKLPSPEETGATFLANALLKARHAATLSGSAAVADDSGLEADALNGAPGIYSARFAGAGADDGANNAKLLRALAGLPMEQRRARYRCALVFIENAMDAAPLIAEAEWRGYILDTPRGAGGFGYDPYFWLPELNQTAAELPPAEKNQLSHRGKAMRALREQLALREQPAAAL
ncbi:MAG TPA: RdgB/HAM1 family non-canonical purine NTP pyrophosphatase [Steroidobacteraceae bacterium]|jgi:XTP/dITP diphosphohydrolase|nr:RdgB/HAM1 family non-canonical purine NTP pyrophosphatase [Steroidobacteraceae bacterium]